MLRKLGFSNHQKKHIRKRVSKLSLRSSFFIWSNRFTPTWHPPTLVSYPTSCTFPPRSFKIQKSPPTSSQLQVHLKHPSTASTLSYTRPAQPKCLTPTPSSPPGAPVAPVLVSSSSLRATFIKSGLVTSSRAPPPPPPCPPSTPPVSGHTSPTLCRKVGSSDLPDPIEYPRTSIDMVVGWIQDPYSVFFPSKDKLSEPLIKSERYFRGTFQAYCSFSGKWLSFTALDHGAYPFGRSHKKGALAALCRLLGITTRSGTFNCCLFTHLLVAVLELKLFTVADLYVSFTPLVKKHRFSLTLRDDDITIKEFLATLKLEDKVFIRTIRRAGIDDNYYMSLETFGNPRGHGIYLAY